MLLILHPFPSSLPPLLTQVKEETGVNAHFRSVVAFRHAHAFAFGKSDLFFVVRLEVEEESR